MAAAAGARCSILVFSRVVQGTDACLQAVRGSLAKHLLMEWQLMGIAEGDVLHLVAVLSSASLRVAAACYMVILSVHHCTASASKLLSHALWLLAGQQAWRPGLVSPRGASLRQPFSHHTSPQANPPAPSGQAVPGTTSQPAAPLDLGSNAGLVAAAAKQAENLVRDDREAVPVQYA